MDPVYIVLLVVGGLYLWQRSQQGGNGYNPTTPSSGGNMGGGFKPAVAPGTTPDLQPPMIGAGASPNGIYTLPDGSTYYGPPPPRPGEAPAPGSVAQPPPPGSSPPKASPPITPSAGGDQTFGGTNSSGNTFVDSRRGTKGQSNLVGGMTPADYRQRFYPPKGPGPGPNNTGNNNPGKPPKNDGTGGPGSRPKLM